MDDWAPPRRGPPPLMSWNQAWDRVRLRWNPPRFHSLAPILTTVPHPRAKIASQLATRLVVLWLVVTNQHYRISPWTDKLSCWSLGPTLLLLTCAWVPPPPAPTCSTHRQAVSPRHGSDRVCAVGRLSKLWQRGLVEHGHPRHWLDGHQDAQGRALQLWRPHLAGGHQPRHPAAADPPADVCAHPQRADDRRSARRLGHPRRWGGRGHGRRQGPGGGLGLGRRRRGVCHVCARGGLPCGH